MKMVMYHDFLNRRSANVRLFKYLYLYLLANQVDSQNSVEF